MGCLYFHFSKGVFVGFSLYFKLCYTKYEELEMDLGLSGKGAVVSGASRGIGRSIALSLASELSLIHI